MDSERAPTYPVTAYASCCALGMTNADVLAKLYAGRTGLRPAELELPFATALGALPEALPALPRGIRAHDTRIARMAVWLGQSLQAAVHDAVRRYSAERVAIVVASSTAGLETTERAHAHYVRMGSLPVEYSFARAHSFGAVVDVLREVSGAGGPGYVVSTACSSGNKVFASAQRLLGSGMADAVLVGGIDTLCQLTVRGFHSLGILSEHACRPFGLGRDGTSIGEGGALLLLERRRDAAVHLLGVGESCDAHHMTQPLPDGSGAAAAIRGALEDARLEPADIDHVNAHGTGTPLNDEAEARALETLFGMRVPVASTKGFTGHVLGAAASLEAVFAIAAIERGQIPQSLGANPLDPALHIDACVRERQLRCARVLSNAFAFGGSNAAVIFGAAA